MTKHDLLYCGMWATTLVFHFKSWRRRKFCQLRPKEREFKRNAPPTRHVWQNYNSVLCVNIYISRLREISEVPTKKHNDIAMMKKKREQAMKNYSNIPSYFLPPECRVYSFWHSCIHSWIGFYENSISLVVFRC